MKHDNLIFSEFVEIAPIEIVIAEFGRRDNVLKKIRAEKDAQNEKEFYERQTGHKNEIRLLRNDDEKSYFSKSSTKWSNLVQLFTFFTR